MAADLSSTRPPAQPSYVFRGHAAHIHSVRFACRNACLVSGDADGWVVYWRLESKRPCAVWRAHEAAILGIAEWGSSKLITHGRDHTIRIWQLDPAATSALSSVLPADPSLAHRPKPWLLHSLPVNTLNFCAFSMCYGNLVLDRPPNSPSVAEDRGSSTGSSEPILIAVPARDDKKIEVYQFPDEKLVAVVPRIESSDTGMVMAVKLIRHQPSRQTLVIAGYEGGFTAVHLVPRNPQPTRTPIPKLARTIYLSQPHTQPVLSLDALPDATKYFTSSADAVIAAHRIPEIPLNMDDEEIPSSEPLLGADMSVHAEQSPRISPILPASERVEEETKNISDVPTEPLVLPSDQETSVTDTSPISFSKQPVVPPTQLDSSTAKPSGLSALLSSEPKPRIQQPRLSAPTNTTIQPPYKTIDTKHAGQQSLRVRSDGRLLVTGGWDSRVRIYSAKTLKEVAVLKWHKEGVYAVDFGQILEKKGTGEEAQRRSDGEEEEGQVLRVETGLSKLRRQREEKLQLKHWVVAGAKDGKLSLWEVF